MSLQLYSQIPGTQVKRDANLSNATIQCDPSALYPLGATQGGVLLNKENLAGALAVEHDLCNLDVNNLTVNGVLKAKGPAEICDIVCPDTFSVRAVNAIDMATSSTVAGQGNINLDSSEVLNLNSQLISVLSTGASTESVDLATATVANIAINTNQLALQDDSSKNISLNTGTLLQSENKDSIVLNAASAVDLGTTARSLILAAGVQTLTASYTDSVAISAAAVVDVTAQTEARIQANTGSVHVQTINLSAGTASDSGFKLIRGTKFFSQNVGQAPAVNFAGGWAAGVGNGIAAGSTDVCGIIEIGGTAGAAGDRVGLTFAVPYNGTGVPYTLTLGIADASAAAGVAITITAQSATGFTLQIPAGANIPADTLIQYQVIALA